MRDSDTVARLGGDEFVVLCEGLRSEHDAVRLAERLATAWTVPFTVAGRELFITASTGIAISSERDEDAATLLREADAAMYRGKEDGRGRRELYDDAMRVRARARLRAEQDLRAAFEREEFRLAYQPVVSLADGRPVGVEALLRLPHPERGLLPAAEFIPLCEELGLLGPLGRWALERACRDLAAWDRSHPGGRRLRLFLNVSARQFAQSDIVEQIACAAAVGPLAPDRLSVDITETAVLGGRRGGHAAAAGAAGAGRPDDGRRLRHGLLGAGLPAPAAARRLEDRPRLRARARAARAAGGDRVGHRRARRRARDDRGGGGRRGRRAAPRGPAPRLRPRAGLPRRATRAGGGRGALGGGLTPARPCRRGCAKPNHEPPSARSSLSG